MKTKKTEPGSTHNENDLTMATLLQSASLPTACDDVIGSAARIQFHCQVDIPTKHYHNLTLTECVLAPVRAVHVSRHNVLMLILDCPLRVKPAELQPGIPVYLHSIQYLCATAPKTTPWLLNAKVPDGVFIKDVISVCFPKNA